MLELSFPPGSKVYDNKSGKRLDIECLRVEIPFQAPRAKANGVFLASKVPGEDEAIDQMVVQLSGQTGKLFGSNRKGPIATPYFITARLQRNNQDG